MSFFFSLFYRVKFGPCMDENKFSSTKHNLRNVWKAIFTWTFSQVIESLIKELLLTFERVFYLLFCTRIIDMYGSD